LYYHPPFGIVLDMNTLTVKIPEHLEAEVIQASAQEHVSKSELVRRALDLYLRQRKTGVAFVSALDQAGDLVGCFAGGPEDLSSNPDHLAAFGRV
jgi:Arc/MetJ-type ribon-helix-helix transcriptional regulator